MARFLILATIILSIISFVSAQIVDTLNTPLGPVAQGATVSVTWTLNPNAATTAASKNGILTAQDMNTKNTITISQSVPLSPPSYNWNVSVPPGTYTLGLNDGSGVKQSGTVQVNAGSGSAAPAPSSGSPAGSPSAPNSPSAPITSSTNSSSASGSNPASSGSSTSSTGASSTSPSGSLPPSSTHSSAGSILGYDVVFSLLGVAVAMIQL